jgi:hypothetical protein
VAVAAYHQDADLDPPTRDCFLRHTMTGIRRSPKATPAPKDPLRTEHLRRALERIQPDKLVDRYCHGNNEKAVGPAGALCAVRRTSLPS